MMFDALIDREQTQAVKLDLRQPIFGRADIQPLWVADTDFAVPECITRALESRIQHPIFGYTLYPESVYEALIQWNQTRHQWRIERESVVMAPGVVPSIFAAVQAFTDEGDGVIIQPPVYFPFFSAVTTNKRKLLLNPLRNEGGTYRMDLEHFEACAKAGAKLFIFCSPHNPVGRVWAREELEALLAITRRYGIVIVSDEIHGDLAYSGHTHIPLQSLATSEDRIITTLAPNKSFNIPGLGLSSLVIPDQSCRVAMNQVFANLHVSNTNPLSMVAFEAAYKEGGEWLDKLKAYLEQSRNKAVRFINSELSGIRVSAPEATYLLWLDCRELGLTDDALKHFFVNDCGLGLNQGSSFGEPGKGFMRLNIGTPYSNIQQALEKIQRALGGSR